MKTFLRHRIDKVTRRNAPYKDYTTCSPKITVVRQEKRKKWELTFGMLPMIRKTGGPMGFARRGVALLHPITQLLGIA